MARFNAPPASRGSATTLAPKDTHSPAEVYFRPESAAALEPPTLSTILRKRLA